MPLLYRLCEAAGSGHGARPIDLLRCHARTGLPNKGVGWLHGSRHADEVAGNPAPTACRGSITKPLDHSPLDVTAA